MSAGDAESPSTLSSDTVGSSTDKDVLAPYLALEEPRLVLDLRPSSAFHQAHLAGSYHISPISELKSRYSYLPPRNIPFLVLADQSQHDEAMEALSAVPSAQLIFLVEENLTSHRAGSNSIVSSKQFFESAQQAGLLRSSQSDQARITDRREQGSAKSRDDDVPQLLFRPSNAVRRTVALLEADHHQKKNTLSVLDLGCGAARDLAWILHGSRTRTSPCPWTGVGIDNWKAALNRAEQLMDDLFLSSSSQDAMQAPQMTPRCHKLLWAKCTDQGFLEPLVGTGKGKSVQADADDLKLWQQYQHLGLSPLLPISNATCNSAAASFDLVICVRFHPRALLPRLSQLVRVGGIILLSHFVTLSDAQRAAAGQAYPEATIDYDSPPHDGRIQPDEIEDLVQIWNRSERPDRSWDIDTDVLEPIEDGRIVRSVTLRKIAV